MIMQINLHVPNKELAKIKTTHMENTSHMKKLKNVSNPIGMLGRSTLLSGAALAGVVLATQLTKADGDDQRWHNQSQVGAIFVIAMENHNFTQPNPTSSPEQIFGNSAAPYINSLITPGNPNAAQVSYATDYLNAGTGVHPSEPNYVWAEAGSDFGFHSDADPSVANGNKFYDNSTSLISSLNANGNKVFFWHNNQTPHLAEQLDGAGIPWKNYQEDVELALTPTNSASGTNGLVNPFYGTTQYNYAVKHNPLAFFNDSALVNVYPLAQLFADLTNNTVGHYNWITPNQYDDAHSSLNGGFTYNGVSFTGDQSAIAVGDNFLSQVIPQIMASKAYQNNGVIVIWWDETEGGDTANQTIPEIIISPLAKGNAYASTVSLNHSSDIKTWEEVFGLPAINNPIPLAETNILGGFNNVATVTDLSDLFVSGAIPTNSFSVTSAGFVTDSHTGHILETVHITNTGTTPVSASLWLALDNLSSNVTLLNADATTSVLAPLGSPAVKVNGGGYGDRDDNVLRPNQSEKITLEYLDPGAAPITYNARVLNVVPAP
jgi:hypothetical protein